MNETVLVKLCDFRTLMCLTNDENGCEIAHWQVLFEKIHLQKHVFTGKLKRTGWSLHNFANSELLQA